MNYPMGRSGYMPCSNPSCFEIAIGPYNPDGSFVPTLCNVCDKDYGFHIDTDGDTDGDTDTDGGGE